MKYQKDFLEQLVCNFVDNLSLTYGQLQEKWIYTCTFDVFRFRKLNVFYQKNQVQSSYCV